MLLVKWVMFGLFEKWVPQNRWKISCSPFFDGHDMAETKNISMFGRNCFGRQKNNFKNKHSWPSFIALPSRFEFPDAKSIVIQWLLISPYICWNQQSKILVTNTCVSFYTISNSKCEPSRNPQLRCFFSVNLPQEMSRHLQIAVFPHLCKVYPGVHIIFRLAIELLSPPAQGCFLLRRSFRVLTTPPGGEKARGGSGYTM